MLLLARSALCIGLVVAALPDTPAVPGGGTSLAARGVAVTTDLCRTDPRGCLRLLHALGGEGGAPPFAGAASHARS